MKNKLDTGAALLIMVILSIMILISVYGCGREAERSDILEKENKQLEQQLEKQEKQHDRAIGQMQACTDTLKGDKWLYIGKFSTTGYCKCSKCCGKWTDCPTFTGTTPKEGRTIAVDPTVIPLGSTVLIGGVEYIAEDTGSAIKGNKIDVYYKNHTDAFKHGKKPNQDVFIKIK